MSQLGLFDDVLARLRAQVEAEYGGPSLLFERFVQFHRTNPHVLDLLVRYATEMRSSGRRRYGTKALFERVRWHLDVETREDTGLKLNNNYTAYYARLLALLRPELRALFTTRALGPGREAQVV